MLEKKATDFLSVYQDVECKLYCEEVYVIFSLYFYLH